MVIKIYLLSCYRFDGVCSHIICYGKPFDSWVTLNSALLKHVRNEWARVFKNHQILVLKPLSDLFITLAVISLFTVTFFEHNQEILRLVSVVISKDRQLIKALVIETVHFGPIYLYFELRHWIGRIKLWSGIASIYVVKVVCGAVLSL